VRVKKYFSKNQHNPHHAFCMGAVFFGEGTLSKSPFRQGEEETRFSAGQRPAVMKMPPFQGRALPHGN
jgi:hypothetical protein